MPARLRLLLVDDAAGYLDTWKEFLERQGHRCVTATSVETAVEAAVQIGAGLDAALIDALIPLTNLSVDMDQPMKPPDEGGFVVAERLLWLSPHVPVVMKTMYGFTDDRFFKALRLPNVCDFVRGDDLSEIEQRLLQAVERSRVYRSGPLNVLAGATHRAVRILEACASSLAKAQVSLRTIPGREVLCAELRANEIGAGKAIVLLRRAAHVGRGIELERRDTKACEVHLLLKSASAFVRELDERRSTGLRCECRCPEGLFVQADYEFLREAFVALLENAYEAIDGADRREITVSARITDESTVVIDVRDTGAGIAEEDQCQLFRPFFTTKQRAGGMGLGLCFAWNVIHQHGGELVLSESSRGRGSTFTINLPLKRAGTEDGN